MSDWKEYRLDEVFDIERGGSPRPIKDYITESKEGINWIKIGDTKNIGKYIYSTKEKIRKEGLKKSRLVKEDDFILSNSMSFGKPYIMKTEGCIHDGWLLLRRISEKTSIDYMYYLLSSNVIKNQFKNKAAGSTVQNLNIKLVESVKALIPPKKEQQKIAEILSTVDEKIDIIDQKIKETEQLKKGMMQRLLTKGIGHTDFKDSPLGEIPVSWEVKELDEMGVDLIDGDRGSNYPKSDDLLSKGHCLFLSAKNITKKGFKFNDCQFITEEIDNLLRKGKLSRNDFIITTRGSVGHVALYDKSIPFDHVRLNSGMVIFRDYKNVFNQKFLYHLLKSPAFENQIDFITSGSAQPQLTIKGLKRLRLPIPSKIEQLKIGEIIDSISDKYEVLLHKKTSFENLKKGLMQKLLTGKIRVNGLIKNEQNA